MALAHPSQATPGKSQNVPGTEFSAVDRGEYHSCVLGCEGEYVGPGWGWQVLGREAVRMEGPEEQTWSHDQVVNRGS